MGFQQFIEQVPIIDQRLPQILGTGPLVIHVGRDVVR
jgi:hypothetical protein